MTENPSLDAFVWNEHFVTGLLSVDDQHHHLVDLVNEFGNLIANDDKIDHATIERICGKLVEYADFHFKDEEQLMQTAGIDKRHVHAHHSEHSRFLKEVAELHRSILSEEGAKPAHLLKFLTHWLAYHILRDDQIMAKQIRLINEGLSPAQAYDRAQDEQDNATAPLLVALNGLFDQVSERNRALKELNRTLERKVQERTQALSEANEHLEQIANTDQLTGLPNRRYAMQRLQHEVENALATGTTLCCVMIDADGFKQINDQFGHDAGDRVLTALSKSLRDAFRTDDLVARLGGDEFIAVLPNTQLDGGIKAAEQARSAITQLNVSVNEGGWRGSISLGVAAFTPEMKDREGLLKAADLAVYQAKRDGRNCVRCYATHAN